MPPNAPNIPNARDRYSNAHLFPKFRGVGPQDAEESVAGRPLFEIQTLHHFLNAATTGNFPGKKTELPLWPAEEMQYFSKKYSEWAPKPYSELPGPAAGPFGAMGGESPPPIFRVTLAMTSMGDMFSKLFQFAGQNLSPEEVARRLSSADKGPSFNITKSKIWFGVAPVSDALWKFRGLDDEANIEEALAILRSVVDVFDYWRQPEVQGKLRDVFNKVLLELDIFNDAIHALRAERGEAVPDWSISRLWEEYVLLHFRFMEQQARSWMFQHLKILHMMWLTRLHGAIGTLREVNETQASIKIDHWAMMAMEKILDIYRDVELMLRFRADGFAMASGIDPRLASIDSPSEERNRIYSQIEHQRMTYLNTRVNDVLNQHIAARHAQGAYPEFLEQFVVISDRTVVYKTLQPHIESPPASSTEPWVRDLSEDTIEMFGFVIYRLSYAETDEKWDAIRTKIENGLDTVWDGIVGSDKIKHKAVLQWVDGRDADNIPEGNLDAARQHFQASAKSPTFAKGLSTTVCLAVTPVSVSSYVQDEDQSDKGTGDFQGFLHAIEAGFDSARVPSSSAPSSTSRPAAPKGGLYKPGYDGTFKISDRLVWSELYALNVQMGQVLGFEDMWAVSARHPWALYMGPSTGVLRRNWREMKGMGGHMVKLAKETSEKERRGS
ncbi:hypothetical protein LHYA1_G007228 [Lachnellula hyalina]|uniref:Uncharacterized protein n=1 Tax=Lachnellula hyalina TaxID=1316788 RepID=A0A8H8QY33_9HELO|nr:uncharacterized protein LHYA1_G007228 [Lachnellula hyalina]TVY24854.1 hypothetical protein LHYA1_G007228 [Lachnellula hyalina]